MGGLTAASNRLYGTCPPDQARPIQRVGKPTPDGGVASLALGGNRSCAVTTAGRAFCWGFADVSNTERRRHGGIASDGRLWLQGPRESNEGLIKFGSDPSPEPTVPKLAKLVQNRFAYCTLDQASVLSCRRVTARDLWSVTYELSVTLANVSTVAVGNDHACALIDTHEALCWGHNERGQLDGTPASTPISQPVRARLRVEHIALGLAHTCVVSSEGKPHIECFGDDTLGQLGGFAKTARRPSVPPFEAADVVELAAGYARTCALTHGGAVWCWGGYLAVDLPSNQPSVAPTRVAELPPDVVQIAAGGDALCARTAQGELYCWGVLQCLDPFACPSAVHPLPSRTTRMRLPARATNVQLGDQHVCVQQENGQVVCMGASQFSQLGAVLPLVETSGHNRCRTKEWFEAWSSPEFLPVAW